MHSGDLGPRDHDVTAAACHALLADFSLGVAIKDVGELARASAVVPPGTRVHVGFTGNVDLAVRAGVAREVGRSGFMPTPLIAARRLRSVGMLREYLAELRAVGATESMLVVGGDPDPPRGPYPDASAVIESGLLEEYGVRQVSLAGHPGGHPAVADSVLWRALPAKAAALERHGLRGVVVTQFGFDAARVLAWLADVRARGVSLPVRVSVPGPARARLLVSYAGRCGVDVSPAVANQYGLSLADPATDVGPERFIRALATDYEPRLHGEVKLHFSTFGGFATTAEWVCRFRDGRG